MLGGKIRIYFVFSLLVLTMCGIIVAASDITGNPITGVLKEKERAPEQLFDITFGLDDNRILDINELVARLTFESFGTVPTPVNITYIILDEMGKRVHFEQESIVVETEMVLEKQFDLDLGYGIYRIFVKTLYNDDVEDEFWKEFEIRKSIIKSLLQLFDISFDLDDSLVSGTEDLVARVNFESFGAEPTPVKLEFIFLDENGNELYSEETYEIVETEKVLVKKFGDLGFGNGEYSLVLKTLYNVDVEDEFVRKFEIKEKNFYLWGFWFSIFGNVVLGGLIFRMAKQSYYPKKRKSMKKGVPRKKYVYR
jgi:hypothetical protein